MTDEQINQRIAEACGWTECRLVAKVVLSVLRDFVAYGVPPNWISEIACLNYCSDLNAMHEAEKALSANQWYDYALALNEVCWHWALIHATARQRAEAFLRTLGKWDDQSGERTEMVREVQK